MIFKRFAASLALATAAAFAVPAAASSAATTTIEAGFVQAGLNPLVLDQAMKNYAANQDVVGNQRYIGIIDYTIHSSQPRFWILDTESGEAEVLLVSHGVGSDPSHEGRPSVFSNTVGSRMTSLGSYVTAETYYGKHGLSLKLDGLSETNSRARERAIVIHGADYVNPARGTQGRSWGCPAVERKVAKTLIEKFKGGAFLYIHGTSGADATTTA
ncbi:murein L,D-transpeptidase catalytic domain family protein [Parvularcula sp. ZS-1/3]|uniref:Murein L,D-transpeptidase catalytic domain family protein n=1 Tax=Parvularcula mediterranea TaxID=2732508 RepID=A0A7Y3W431_9PROT|nr:murein L,D-transpeptidase catalytic domain family protein [Parvularcula mediterranea]NNU15099.1 murein L,D-transpeptidase catalytic domain family protein [Parvularcula mediterranea]